MFGTLTNAYCKVAGKNSGLVAFIAAAAILIFFVLLTINEGKETMTWGLKILIGVSGMIMALPILDMVFPGLAFSCSTSI